MAEFVGRRSRRATPSPAAPPNPQPSSDLDLPAQIEEAAEFAVDTAQRLIAILDSIDGDTDLEEGADAEPSLAALENHHASQVGCMCGGDQDREGEALEDPLPDVAVEAWPLPWSGRANVIAAAGVALIDLIERAG